MQVLCGQAGQTTAVAAASEASGRRPAFGFIIPQKLLFFCPNREEILGQNAESLKNFLDNLDKPPLFVINLNRMT